MLVFNSTNKFVDLAPELAKIAQEKNLTCINYGDYGRVVFIDENGKRQQGERILEKYPSDWVMLQRKKMVDPNRAFNGGLPLEQRLDMRLWMHARPEKGPMWTDNYSNLLRALYMFKPNQE